VTSGNAVRGRRVGAGPMGEPDRGAAAPCIRVSFWCADRHQTRLRFAVDALVPETWDCPRCGNPAGQNEQDPPARPRSEPYKSHLAYVKERRSDSDGAAILAEALARLHGAASTPAPASLPAASREDGRAAEQDPPRGRRPTRRGPAAVTGHRRQASRSRGEAPRAAGRALRPGRASGVPDLAAAGAPPAHPAPTRRSAMSSPGDTGPAPAGPPAEGYCGGCGYPPTALGHKITCLGQ